MNKKEGSVVAFYARMLKEYFDLIEEIRASVRNIEILLEKHLGQKND